MTTYSLNLFEDYNENIEQENVIMVGDYNYDYSNVNALYNTKIKTVFYERGLSQIVETPTRITPYSRSLIDYIVTNKQDLKHEVHLTPRIGDHCILSVDIDNGNMNMNEKVIVKKRYMKKYKKDKLQNEIILSTWNNSSNCVDYLEKILQILYLIF